MRTAAMAAPAATALTKLEDSILSNNSSDVVVVVVAVAVVIVVAVVVVVVVVLSIPSGAAVILRPAWLFIHTCNTHASYSIYNR